MKHLKEEKERKPLSKGAKIAICATVGVVVALTVFLVLLLTNQVSGYREAKNYTDEILSTRGAVVAFLDAEGDDELSNEDIELYKKFKSAVEKSESYTESLSASKAMKNEVVSEKYKRAKKELEKLSRYRDVEVLIFDAMEDGELSDDELKVFAESKNDFLVAMATDLTEHRAKFAEFYEKYGEFEDVNDAELDSEYSELMSYSESIAKKYAKISMMDVVGMSRDDILHFYDTIEELNNYLAEKI